MTTKNLTKRAFILATVAVGSGDLQIFLDFSQFVRDNKIWQEININNLRGHLCTVEEFF